MRQKAKEKRITNLYKRWMIKTIAINPKRSVVKNLILFCGKVALSWERLPSVIKRLDVESKKTSDDEMTEYVGIPSGISKKLETRLFRKEWFEKSIMMSFEGKEYPVPIGYDGFLTQLYGDYMSVPSKEQCVYIIVLVPGIKNEILNEV